MLTESVIKYSVPSQAHKVESWSHTDIGMFLKLFKPLARRDRPMESGCDYAMEKMSGTKKEPDEWREHELEWLKKTETKPKHQVRKEVRPFLEIVLIKSTWVQSGLFCFYHRRTEHEARAAGQTCQAHCSSGNKNDPQHGNNSYVTHPSWCYVVLCCHGDHLPFFL